MEEIEARAGAATPGAADPADADGSSRAQERALAEALIAGRPEAFEPFVERYAPLILNFGRRMCGHRDDADEVLQDTLLSAYQSIRSLREPAALKSWVYRVAAHACLKLRRRGKHAPPRDLSLDEVLPARGADGRPPQIADWSEVPLRRLLQREMRRKIEEAILGLPEDHRIVLVLRDQEGLDTRETAEILGISENLAKVRLHRARLALRKALDGYLAAPKQAPTAGRAHREGEMTCREMADLLSGYVDGELEVSLRRKIDAHGGECPPCRAFVRTLIRTVEAVRSQPRRPLPARLKVRLARALRSACA